MRQYYIVKNEASSGPFTIQQLKYHGIQPETKVWYEGLPEWVEARAVPELAELWVVPVVSYAPSTQSQSGIDWKLVIWLVVIAGVLGTVGVYLYSNSFNVKDFSTERKFSRENWRDFVQTGVEHAEPMSDFGGFKNITIGVVNNMNYPVDEIKVELVYRIANGKQWNTETLIFTNVGAKKKVTQSAPDSFRGIQLEPTIVGIRSDAIKLNHH